MNDKRKIFGAFVIAIALFFFWPTVVGQWQEISALKSAIAEREDLLKSRTDILANVANIYRQYQAKVGQTDGQKFTALVPVRKNSAELVSAIQEIAESNGLVLTEMNISEGKDVSGPYKTLTLDIRLRGSYPSLHSFLEGLEQYVRLLNVGNVQVSKDSQNDSLLFAVKADTYFLR